MPKNDSRSVWESVQQQLSIKKLNSGESVSELLEFPFLQRSLQMKRKIIAAGRPALIKNMPMRNSTGPTYDGHFYNPALFEQVHWLVRCDKRRKFFCYNCLLYAPSNAMLRTSVRLEWVDLPTLLECARDHELTEGHMVASIQLQMFMKENFPTLVRVAQYKTQRNLTVKRNREILRRLIDAVYCAVGQKHSHGDGKYTHTEIKVDDCAKFLELLRKVDVSNADLIDGAADILKRYPRIVNDLVDAISRVLKTAIKNEIQQSAYVSVILSEHGMPQIEKSQVSCVLRYIKRGKVCERFIGFTNFIGSNSKETIYKIIFDVMQQYGIREKFLALSLDGKVLPKEDLRNLLTSLKIDYQFSYFVPWHSHGFGNTLLQTLSGSDECGLFLKKIKAMEKFFENPKPRESLEFTLLSKHTELRARKWYEKSPFIVFVATYRHDFIEFFDGVIENCKYWKTDDIANILSFRCFLQEVRTVFLLWMFKKIFLQPYFDETFNFSCEREEKMLVFDNPRIAAFKKSVGSLRFQYLRDIVVADIKRDSKLASEMKHEWVRDFTTVFHKILRDLYQEIDIRCYSLSRLTFCDLLNYNRNGKFVFSQQLLRALISEHGAFFNISDLLCEVAALNEQPMFQSKSVHELLECFADLNLSNVLPQIYKLAEFILTLPFMPASQNEMTSKLRDIKKCSFIPQNTGLPSGEASFLCIESKMLDEIKESPLFYEDVLARFNELNKYLLLIQG